MVKLFSKLFDGNFYFKCILKLHMNTDSVHPNGPKNKKLLKKTSFPIVSVLSKVQKLE